MDRALLFLASVLLAASGALKARSAARSGIGVTLLPLVELLFAVVVAALAMAGLASGGLGLGVLVTSVVLVIGSSIDHAGKLRARRRQRQETEASRLAQYVRYSAGGSGDSE